MAAETAAGAAAVAAARTPHRGLLMGNACAVGEYEGKETVGRPFGKEVIWRRGHVTVHSPHPG